MNLLSLTTLCAVLSSVLGFGEQLRESIRGSMHGRTTTLTLQVQAGQITGESSDFCTFSDLSGMHMSGSFNEEEDHICKFTVNFDSEISCEGSINIRYPPSTSAYVLYANVPCVSVVSSEGSCPSGPEWPCQNDGCTYAMINQVVTLRERVIRPPRIFSYWIAGPNEAADITVSSTKSVSSKYSTSSGSDYSAFQKGEYSTKNSAGVTVTVPEQGSVNANSETSSGVSAGFNEAWRSSTANEIASSSSYSENIVRKVSACSSAQQRWIWQIQVDGSAFTTQVAICAPASTGAPRCPSPALCVSLDDNQTDCQCCRFDTNRLLSSAACPDNKLR